MKSFAKNRFAVKKYNRIMRIANWLQDLPNKVTPAPFRLIQIGSAFWQSRALSVVTKLEIAEAIEDSSKSTHELAKQLNLKEDHLYRLMRMVASIGIFKEVSHRVFINNKTSQYLRKNNPDNVRSMVLMHNSPEMTMPWIESLESSIRDGGIPFKKNNKLDLFDYMNQNEAFDSLFSQAMDSVENVAGSDFLKDLQWNKFTRIIDIGGSKGSKSIAILKNNPLLKSVVFDRPQVIAEAKKYWHGKIEKSILNRIEFAEGDALKSIPKAESNTDVYFFMAVFHTFDDKACKQILLNLKKALGDKKPYIIIADAVASEIEIDSILASMDMQMLMGTKGRERTLREWKSLFHDTGFQIKEVIDIRTFVKYIVVEIM